DGAIAFLFCPAPCLADCQFVQGHKFPALAVQPAFDADDILALDQRGGLAVLSVVELKTRSAGDVISVLDAGGGQQQHGNTTAFEECVQALCGAVDQEIDVREIIDYRFEASDDAGTEVPGRG